MSVFDLFKKKNSGTVAKDRLKLLLVSDRASCSPEIMEAIKNLSLIHIFPSYRTARSQDMILYRLWNLARRMR